MTTVNKLKNIWVSDDTTNLDGTYGKVSILNYGKTELQRDTLINTKLAINKNIDSVNDYKLDVSGNIKASAINVDSIDTKNANISPVINSVPIANWNFATPARSLNTAQNQTAPYTAITGWTITAVVGTPFAVAINNGFATYINTYQTLYPDYPAVTQALSVSQNTVPNTLRVSQNITFTETGNYQLTFWIWGMYNTYRRTQTVTASINSYSNVFIGVEQLWTKCLLRFNISTVGSYALVFDFINGFSGSVLSMTSVKIEKQTGLIVSDGGIVNNQLINQTGLYTTAIENRGPLTNYGYLKNYGALGLFAPYSNGSVCIGSTSYGTVNPADGGAGSVFIGSSNVVASPNSAVTANYCIGIGMGALEQLTSANRLHGIGFRCLRYNSGSADNIGYGYSCGEYLGYSGSSSNRNVCIGNYALNHPASTNDCVSIGHNNMTTANFTTGTSFCVSVGSTSMTSVASNYNTQIGYGAVTQMINTASNYNSFFGAQVCTNQNGSANVLLNCTFLGATSNVSTAGSYSNSTCVGFGSLINGNNRIILGRSTEVTYPMGGLNIPVSTVLTLLGNISANSLTITPVQLSFLNQVASNQIPSTAINNTSFLTSTITSNLTANSLTITPVQLSFLNQVITTAGSPNIGLIPQSAIANISDFVKYNTNVSITGVFTFSTNPTFNTGSIPVSVLSNINDEYVDRSTSQDINGTKTFNNAPIMSGAFIEAGSIPGSAIDEYDLAEVITAILPGLLPAPVDTTNFVDITSDQTIGGSKTFSSAPHMSGAHINSGTIPVIAVNGLASNFARKTMDQTITGVYNFSANPIFNDNAILDTYLSTNITNSVSTANTFMNTYNTYINFVSNIAGDTMNLINCNPKLTAGYNLDITGANIIANGTTISDVQVSFLNQIDASNKIPTSAINGYGSGYLTISSASSTYQTISGMSNYASITGLSKLGGSINVMGGSYSLNFGDNRFLIMDSSPIISSIGLPSPTSSNNLGCIFSIVNKAGIPPNRSVSAPSGQNIYDFNTATIASSIVIKDIGVIEFVCVGVSPTDTTTWAVLNRDDTVLKSGNQTIAGIKTFSSPPVMSGASISAGTIPYTAINSSYIPYSVATLSTSADVTLSSPLNNYYTFTSGASITTITLPLITTNIIGCPLTFRRVGNTTSALNIKTPASSATTIVQRASINETAQNTNYTLLATNQFIATVMAISLTKWSVIT
jgi:hypothetical protein